MFRGRVSLQDIARETGVSANTVSRALRDCGDISTDTKERIRRAAERLGYIENASAQLLRSGKSRTVAIILGDVSNPIFAAALKVMERWLRAAGYASFVLNTDEDFTREREAIVTAVSQNVGGVLICPSQDGGDNIRYLKSFNIPFVTFGRYLPEVPAYSVVCDDEQSGYLLTAHLLESGRSPILFLNGPDGISSARERQMGYIRAHRDFNVPFSPGNIHVIPVTTADSRPITDALKNAEDFSAVMCFSDILALQAMRVLNRIKPGWREHIVVAGFDNIQAFFPLPFPLISVDTVDESVSEKAAELLTDMMNGRKVVLRRHILATRLADGVSAEEVKNKKK